MIRLMSDCLLRISEVVAVNVGDFKGSTLTLRSSKTDQEGAGETLYVCDNTRELLKQYREQAEIGRGAVFRHIRRGGHVQSGSAHNRLRTPYHPETRARCGCGKVSSLGTRCGSDLRSRSHKPVRLLSICKSLDAGNPHRMPAHYAKAELAERGAIARFKDGKR